MSSQSQEFFLNIVDLKEFALAEPTFHGCQITSGVPLACSDMELNCAAGIWWREIAL